MKQEIQQAVDKLLLEQGSYTPLELLLAEGRLFYEDYESWRMGEAGCLDETLFGDPKQSRELLTVAVDYAKALGLQPETVNYGSWGANKKAIRFSAESDFDHCFHTRYVKAADVPQMDLFMDSGGTVLLNGIVQALMDRDAVEARKSLDQLFDIDPGNRQIGGLEQLVEAAESTDQPVNDSLTLLRTIELELAPLALDLLGAGSHSFLAPQWRRFGHALEGVLFQPEMPDLHWSYAAVQAGDWRQATAGIELITDWREHSVLICRHAQACGRLHEPEAELSSWFLLCWSFPDEAGCIEKQAEPRWRRRWQDFLNLEQELPNHLFPEWVILQEPGLALFMALDASTVPDAYRLIKGLIAGGTKDSLDATVMEKRQQLKACCPEVFPYYLQRVSS